MTDVPGALMVAPHSLPDSLPESVGGIESPLYPSPPATSPVPLTLFLTVDVEDAYFNQPILMTGEGVGRDFGVFGILDELAVHDLSATFFVNVYETSRQPDGVVEGVVKEIHSRGHEVGLHTHPSTSLEFYNRPLFRLDKRQQENALRWGADLIRKWTGVPPSSFRAGGYALNDDTILSLKELGFIVDSSCFFPSPNNRNTRRSVNAVVTSHGVIEAPVTTVLRANSDGELAHRKLDLDWLEVDELIDSLTTLNNTGARFATFMMHSFSFIAKQTRDPKQPPSPQARFISDVNFGRYAEVYGPKPEMRDSFAKFLRFIATSPAMRACTFRDAAGSLASAMSNDIRDVVPLTERR